jgi:GT2 family glycosyltransferase
MQLEYQKESVYILIPVHNRREITLRCLDHLQRQMILSQYYVVVIDDGSTDGTSEMIEAQYPQVILIKGDGNLWWTGAIKKGMKHAYQHNAEYFIWLNDDCLPDVDTLKYVIDFLSKNINTVVAPICYLEKTQKYIENGCQGRRRVTASPNQIIPVDSMAGYCVGFPKSLIDYIGFPDNKRFPHYGGDDMYLLRGTRCGFKAYILGDAKVALAGMDEVTHDFTSYINQRFVDNFSVKTIFFEKKSRYSLLTQFFYFMQKYYFPVGLLVFILKACAWFFQYLKIKMKLLKT